MVPEGTYLLTYLPLDPGSGMIFFRIPDPTHISESLVTIFWV